ncbi:hypothetical protein E2C01_026810 [Portunus trituberculatus]|uniref:Uncharacterized protein n=1 Tax=Portunus trituberculatus TaxID=210409 RepID=A0A5B7EGA4_PORTR|nr:hypothetical protein [Portunus trituberculatus]
MATLSMDIKAKHTSLSQCGDKTATHTPRSTVHTYFREDRVRTGVQCEDQLSALHSHKTAWRQGSHAHQEGRTA